MTTPFNSVEGLTRRFAEPSGRGELTVFEDLWFGVDEGEPARTCDRRIDVVALAAEETAVGRNQVRLVIDDENPERADASHAEAVASAAGRHRF